jgi:hypothetical protein
MNAPLWFGLIAWALQSIVAWSSHQRAAGEPISADDKESLDAWTGFVDSQLPLLEKTDPERAANLRALLDRIKQDEVEMERAGKATPGAEPESHQGLEERHPAAHHARTHSTHKAPTRER